MPARGPLQWAKDGKGRAILAGAPTVGAAVRGRGELYELDTVAGDGGARDASAGEVRSSECSRQGPVPCVLPLV